MPNVPVTANQFDAGVYQIETNDPVVGGAAGISNKQAINLANRTEFLKAAVDAVITGEGGTPDNVDPTLLYAAIQAAVAAGSTPLPSVITQAAAEAGVSTIARLWTAERVRQAAQVVGEPTGAINICPSSSPFPGTVFLSGLLLDRTIYADLWAYANASGNIVTDAAWAVDQWGSFSTGDGATTFRIPDFHRGDFIRGLDLTGLNDPARVLGSGQADDLKSHTHTLSQSGYGGAGAAAAYNWTTIGTYQTAATGGAETRPRNIAEMFCIKY